MYIYANLYLVNIMAAASPPADSPAGTPESSNTIPSGKTASSFVQFAIIKS
jgi:hypothetical protein